MSKLIIQWPIGQEQMVEMSPGQTLTLGRAEHNTVCINDGTLSRRHARLTWRDDDTCIVEDLQSTNGTTLNGSPIVRPEILEDGDRLRFGAIPAVYLSAGYLAAEADTVMLSAPKPSVGEMFAGCYRLESTLSETAEYNHFLALELPEGSRKVSLKIFPPSMIVQVGGFEQIARTFTRVRAAPAHPGLVRLLDFKRWRGSSYLAAEWIDGCTLLDVLRRRRALPVPEAMQLARQAAAAVDHCRTHGLPTPDVAPRSVLLAFNTSPPGAAREALLDQPLERWPVFTLKLSPRIFEPTTPVSVPVPPLGALVRELLGRPATARYPLHPSRIASLGEAGNDVLADALASNGQAFDDDTAFITALARAAGVVDPGDPAAKPPSA